MRKFLLLAAVAMLPIPAGAADMLPTKAYNAVTPPTDSFFAGGYAGLEAAYGWNEIKASALGEEAKFDPSKFAVGGVAGYRWGRTLMFGLEVSGKYAGAKHTIDGVTGNLQYYGDVSAQLGLALNNGVLLYVLAGPSWANFKASDGEISSTVNYFGGHVGAGVDIKAFTENFVIGLQYKHHEWGNGTLISFVDTKAKNDEVMLRALYRFAPGH